MCWSIFPIWLFASSAALMVDQVVLAIGWVCTDGCAIMRKIIRAYTGWDGYSQAIYYCVDRGLLGRCQSEEMVRGRGRCW